MQITKHTRISNEFAKLWQISEAQDSIVCKCWDCDGRKGIPSSGRWYLCKCCNGNGTITINKSNLIYANPEKKLKLYLLINDIKGKVCAVYSNEVTALTNMAKLIAVFPQNTYQIRAMFVDDGIYTNGERQ